jgi:hypothetical protein
MIDGDDCGATSGMNEWHGEIEVLGGNLPQYCCPKQIPHNLTWAAVVESQQLAT